MRYIEGETEYIPGLGVSLTQDPEAMSAFQKMEKNAQARMISFVQGGSTRQETSTRVQQAVEMIKSGSWKDEWLKAND